MKKARTFMNKVNIIKYTSYIGDIKHTAVKKILGMEYK